MPKKLTLKNPTKKNEPEINNRRDSAGQNRAPRKPKPITVAQTPMIGNYQLPPMDFLQHPDMTVKPTESKEELMANARLMQQTLAQFDIEVSARRHHQRPDHHALRIASCARREAGKNRRALQQHRRRAQGRAHPHPRARARKKFRRRRSAERRSRQRSSCATCSSPTNGATPRRAFPSRSARTSTAIPSSPTSRKCRTCSSPAAPVPANPSASTPSSRRCSTVFRPTSCAS